MKLAFFGTPQWAVPTLEALLSSKHEVNVLVCQPDKPQGRGQNLQPQPVKEIAERHALEIIQPQRAREADFVKDIKDRNLDAGVLVAYGQLIPDALLDSFRHGIINLHPSLLPAYRGPAPVQGAIINGEKEVGISTMRLVQELDAGPIFLQERVVVDADENALQLSQRLFDHGAQLVLKTVDALECGELVPHEQKGEASYFPKLTKQDGHIDWSKPALEIHNHIRGMQPWPGAFSFWQSKRLKVLRSKRYPVPFRTEATPGAIIECSKEGIMVACGEGQLCLEKVQLEGKAPVSAYDFSLGYQLKPAMHFDSEPAT